jgi:pimeloyl-ACP methyl ester carboxylesterase
MKTMILPGYSPHNREWAEAIAAGLSQAEVHSWAHWESGGSMDARQELAAILQGIGKGPVHLLAKSVGCRLAARIIVMAPEKIRRVVFCGIPSTRDDAKEDIQAALAALPPGRALVVQNAGDPYAAYAEVAAMFAAIGPGVQVLERPRDDHHYPYPQDFRDFLESAEES